MKPRYYFFIAAALVLMLGIYWVFSTIPQQPKEGGPLPTPTLNLGQRLTGERLDGQLLFTRAGNLWAWRGGDATRLAIEPGNSTVANNQVKLLQPAWSPDDGSIAYIRQDESFSDLWVVNADGSQNRALTSNKGKGQPRTDNYDSTSLWAYSPTWSPDGSQIAYLADVQTDDLALWVTAVRNPQPHRLSALGVGQGGIQHPDWSPDGSQIAVAAYEGGKPQIFVVRVNNAASTKLTEAAEGAYDPAWSPDGKSIAYVVRRGNSSDLWLMRADGSGQVQLVSGMATRTPVWSPDGSKVAFLALKGSGFEIFTVGINASGAAGEPKQISRDARIDSTSGLSWGR